jgi:hypothetical protein
MGAVTDLFLSNSEYLLVRQVVRDNIESAITVVSLLPTILADAHGRSGERCERSGRYKLGKVGSALYVFVAWCFLFKWLILS